MSTSTVSLEQLQKEIDLLKQENSWLKEQLEWFRRQIFGSRSEKVIDIGAAQPDLPGFDKLSSQATPAKTRTVAAHERKTPVRNGKDAITLPPNLPVETQVIDLPEDEKICKETGKPLVKIGEEVSQKLAHKPGSFYIKQTIRPKYALPPESMGGIKVAELPEGLLSRCFADESLLAEILVRKYSDHLPLHRLAEILARDGVKISRQTLCKWVMRAGHALEPLYEAMKRYILQSGIVFIDETPLEMQDPGKGKTKQVYMWVLVSLSDEKTGCSLAMKVAEKLQQSFCR